MPEGVRLIALALLLEATGCSGRSCGRAAAVVVVVDSLTPMYEYIMVAMFWKGFLINLDCLSFLDVISHQLNNLHE